MSTGPQHYAEAERLLASRDGVTYWPNVLAEAQVHATLALAAATALGHREASDHEDSYGTSILPDDDYTAWWRISSEGPAVSKRRRENTERELAEFCAEYRGVRRDKRDVTTAEWFHASVAAGCTGVEYDSDNDTIIHDGAPACPIHEPGDVVPAEERLTPQPELYRDSFGRQHAKPWGAGF